MAAPSVTKEQAEEALKAAIECGGNISHAADHLEIGRAALQNRLARGRQLWKLDFSGLDDLRKARLQLKGQSILYGPDGEQRGRWDKTTREGRAPEDVEHLPDPKKVTKISTLYDQTGRVTQQWIAEKPEDAAREALWRAFALEMAAKVTPLKPIAAPRRALNKDLLTVYPVGDHHTGMYAWGLETGEADWDLKIAERTLAQAVDHLVAAAPPSETALAAFMGDFLHYDSYSPVTPANRNLLDADSRFPKMVQAGVRSMRRMVSRLLEKHRFVCIIVEPGNHDPASSVFLVECLRAAFENEPRVKIDTSPRPFHYFEFGLNLIGTTHGDGVKLDKLPAIMAADVPEMWGRAKFRVWLTGHVHHESKREFPGCKVETLEVLPPADAWAAKNGYRSARGMKAIVFHREHGEQARHVVNPGMFKKARTA